eukprot:jgi/Chlat1/6094/Chrsp40S05672
MLAAAAVAVLRPGRSCGQLHLALETSRRHSCSAQPPVKAMAEAVQQQLPTRRLGRDGPEVSAIGLGCMGLSGAYGNADEEESLRLLNTALDYKCNFWDSADAYGGGHNERLVGKILKDRRDEVFICTKFGFKAGGAVDGSPSYVKQACQASLDRLGVDCIDLYYQHRVDPTVPIEDTVGAMADLVHDGKVRFLGLSECSAETLRRAHKVHPITAVQMEFSPWTLDIEENGILDAARELGVSVVAYSPLGNGFLTGRFKSPQDLAQNDFRLALSPRFQGDNFYKNVQLAEKFQELAKQKGVTSAQLVLAWVLAQDPCFIPIPGTKREKYLLENIAGGSVQLSKEDLSAVRAIVDSIGVAGERKSPAMMKQVGH